MAEQQYKKYIGTFLGLATTPQPGEKNGKQWTRNKLKMSHAEGKENTFSTFQDISTMQMGKNYKLVYVENPHPTYTQDDGSPTIMKKAIKIEEDNTGELGFKGTSNNSSNTQQSQTVYKETPESYYKFYKEKIPTEKHGNYHFALTYLASNDPTLEPLIQKLVSVFDGLEAKEVTEEKVPNV